ncbi:hypothetical protein N7535_002662 [Penicillium sp. DV-2018c]|nr:hypothetical protein N7461_001653 [Penicillium sp. DV-2018c]KAJ5575736.1 hypothetical protein N7535_002662 [Penicillium sp. DV-2018c]
MANASRLQLSEMKPTSGPHPTNIVVPVHDDEHFNVPSEQRKRLLAMLDMATSQKGVLAVTWALVQVCDMDRLQWIVNVLSLSGCCFDLLNEITCGLPFRWSFQPPQPWTTFSSIPPRALSKYRSGLDPRSAIWDAKARDNLRCSEGLCGSSNLPRGGGTTRLANNSWAPDIWRYIDVFWGSDTAARWRKAVFKDPEHPEIQVDDCSNLICLRHDLRGAWLDGYFALRPVWVSDDQTEMEIEFHWQVQYTHNPFSLIRPNMEPLPSRVVLEMNGLIVKVGGDETNPAGRPIRSGYRFKVSTNNPVTHPLPSYDLLDMQWHMNRIMAMSSVGRFFSSNGPNVFEAQGVQPNSNVERDNRLLAFEAQGEQSWFDTEEDVDSPDITEEQVEDPWPAAAFPPPNRPLPPIPRTSSTRSLDTLGSTSSTERPLSPFPEVTADFDDVTF